MNWKIIKKIRKDNNLKLQDVVNNTGLSIGFLNRIERGHITDIKNKAKRNSLIGFISRYDSKYDPNSEKGNS